MSQTNQVAVAQQLDPKEVRLKDVRIAFANGLFTATAVEAGQQKKFNGTFLVPLSDKAQIAAVEKAIFAAAEEKWGPNKAKSVIESLRNNPNKFCFKNGATKPNYEGFEGNMFISASTKTRPMVVDRQRQPLTEEDGKPYSGCYVNARLQIWAMDNKYGKGIFAQLASVQFVRDGDAFSGGIQGSADDFEDLGVDDSAVDDLA